MKHIKSLSFAVLAICVVMVSHGCDQQQPVTKQPEPVKKVASEPAATAPGPDPDKVTVTIVEFDEVESGVEPYTTRMTVSDRYIRIDDSGEAGGFVLFDREKKRIFSVVHDNRSILVVDPVRPLADRPEDLLIRSELIQDQQTPTLAGIRPDYYQFYANEQLCYHLVAVEGFMPDVANALRSYQSVLAAQQQETLLNTPKELQTPCFLANYIYAAGEYSSKGFPVEQWDLTGYRRSLSGVEENIAVDPALFTLPDGYSYFSIGGQGNQI
jgi:hypothetical protein